MTGIAVWLCLAVFAAALFSLWCKKTALARERCWIPQELASAKLAYAERLFRSRDPWLVAKIDRGYRLGGKISLVELKTRTRHRVYRSDVIELSAQRVALETETGECVADTAFVLTEATTRRTRQVHRVKLMDRSEVVALIERRESILAGFAEPKYARSARLCDDCSFRDRCRPPH